MADNKKVSSVAEWAKRETNDMNGGSQGLWFWTLIPSTKSHYGGKCLE